MNIRFYGVIEDEVEEILLNPGEDWLGRRKMRNALGQTQGGRYLQVVYVRDSKPNSVFVITAYALAEKPLTAYRRRQRRKGRR